MDRSISTLLENGHINVAETIARFGGNENMFLKYLRRFPADPSFKSLEQAMQTNDLEAIKTACHTLKGVSGTLGLDPLFQATSEMMVALRASGAEGIEPLYKAVLSTYSEAISMIDALPQ